MRKLLLLGAFAVCLFVHPSIAGNAHLFELNEEKIAAEFSDLTTLENYIGSHEGVTLSDLSNLSDWGNGLNMNTSEFLASLASFEPPLGIPSFVWGFCLGWVGLLITYLVADDKEETKKALWGCIAGSALWVVIYIIYVAVIVAAAASSV